MNKEKLVKILDQFGIKISAEQVDKFLTYESLLLEWNNKFNLTAILDEEGILVKHFVDSIIPVKYVDFEGKTLADIGTGAGFPGIPLAIMNPSLKVTLVEANGKKILFLNEVKNQLGLDNVEVIKSRAEDLSNFKEKFDYVSARAVTQLNVLSELSIPLLKIHGKMVCLKLYEVEDEIARATHALKALGAKVVLNEKYELPIEEGKRSLVLVEKLNKTKNKYPRNFAEISKSPL